MGTTAEKLDRIVATKALLREQINAILTERGDPLLTEADPFRLYPHALDYSPEALFLQGEQGLWLDPSDKSTMYQDSAGATAVTAPSQPVGLILDKSKGLQVGPELIQPLDFNSPDWNVLGTVTIDNANTFTASVGAAGLYFQLEPNSFYELIIDFTSNTSFEVRRLQVGSSSTTFLTSSGSVLLRTSATEDALYLRNAAAGTTTVNNLTVRKLAGNHAYQTTSASRPIYAVRPFSGVRNLFTNSEFQSGVSGVGLVTETTMDFGNGSVAGAAIGYDGSTLTYLYSGVAPASAACAISVYVEMDDGLAPVFGNIAGSSPANDFALVIGGTPVDPTTYTVENVFGNVYRVSGSGTTGTGSLGNNGVVKYGGNSNRTFKWSGRQLELGAEPTPYQKVVSQYEVTEAGVPDIHCLVGDGIDDFLNIPIPVVGSGSFTMLSGHEVNNITRQNNIIEGADSSGLRGGRMVYFSGNYQYQTGSGSTRNTVNSGVASGKVVGTFKYTGSDMITYTNGGNSGMLLGVDYIPPTENSLLFVERTSSILTNYMNGEIFCVIAIQRSITDIERERTEKYIAAKTGVTLA